MSVYAPTGYSFHSINTPARFHEALLPDDLRQDTPKERIERDRLAGLAETHQATIDRTAYRRG